jgi:uncharacterized membrane protein YadS
VVLFLSVLFRNHRPLSQGGSRLAFGQLTPWFLLAFMALAIANNLLALPTFLVSGLTGLSGWCLVVSIAALGVKTSLEKLAALGWRPIVLFALEALFILAWMLLALRLGRTSV